MIKVYCDRCEEEITGEKKSFWQKIADAFSGLFGDSEEQTFSIYKENGTDKPFKVTLCENCTKELQDFMKKPSKTAVYPERNVLSETETEKVIEVKMP